MLVTIDVVDEVLGTVWPGVRACSILLAILPSALEILTVWVVEHTRPITFVEFELSLICLAVGPQVGALTVLLAHVKVAIV